MINFLNDCIGRLALDLTRSKLKWHVLLQMQIEISQNMAKCQVVFGCHLKIDVNLSILSVNFNNYCCIKETVAPESESPCANGALDN